MVEAIRERSGPALAAGVGERIDPVVVDMHDLPFDDACFDLVWSEGAAYIMGFEDALRGWRRLLAPGGHLAVTELVWTRPDPPAEVAAFFAGEYPPMACVGDVAARFAGCGYDLLGHFTLPDAVWWDDYHTPLEAKLPGLRERYCGDAVALEIVAATAREIGVRRRFADCYGYEFFVARAAG